VEDHDWISLSNPVRASIVAPARHTSSNSCDVEFRAAEAYVDRCGPRSR
jgi:hypothetical protein